MKGPPAGTEALPTSSFVLVCILQALAWSLPNGKYFYETQKSQPGVPLVRLTLKTRSPATAAASRQFFSCLDSLAHVGLGRVSASKVGGVRRNLCRELTDMLPPRCCTTCTTDPSIAFAVSTISRDCANQKIHGSALRVGLSEPNRIV